MIEVSVLEAGHRMYELLDAALAGEAVVITRGGDRVALEPYQEESPHDAEAHLAELRHRLAGPAPAPTAAEMDADIRIMRGRG